MHLENIQEERLFIYASYAQKRYGMEFAGHQMYETPICTHCIVLKDDAKHIRQMQCRLSPAIKE